MTRDTAVLDTVPTGQGGGSDPEYKVGPGKPPLHSRFKKGQSGNPSGKNGSEIDVLRAFARRKPKGGGDRTHWEMLVQKCYDKAMAGCSRHMQLFFDRLAPHKSIRINEDNRTLTVTMSLAAPPEGWKPPELLIDADGDGKLLPHDKGDISQ